MLVKLTGKDSQVNISRHFIILLYVFIALASISSTSFAGMILIDDDRYIANGQGGSIRPGSSAVGSYWSVYTSYADQASSFGEYRLNGTGNASRTQNFNTHSSVYSVTFSVDEVLSYDLSADLYAPYADIEASLWENDSRLFLENIPRYQSSSSFDYSGLFELGNEYTLIFSVERIGSSFAPVDDNWSFNLSTEVVTVPVPAAAWLMMCGLGVLFGVSRKRNSRNHN